MALKISGLAAGPPGFFQHLVTQKLNMTRKLYFQAKPIRCMELIVGEVRETPSKEELKSSRNHGFGFPYIIWGEGTPLISANKVSVSVSSVSIIHRE